MLGQVTKGGEHGSTQVAMFIARPVAICIFPLIIEALCQHRGTLNDDWACVRRGVFCSTKLAWGSTQLVNDHGSSIHGSTIETGVFRLQVEDQGLCSVKMFLACEALSSHVLAGIRKGGNHGPVFLSECMQKAITEGQSTDALEVNWRYLQAVYARREYESAWVTLNMLFERSPSGEMLMAVSALGKSCLRVLHGCHGDLALGWLGMVGGQVTT